MTFCNRVIGLIVVVLVLIGNQPAHAQSQLEAALADLYATHLFESVEDNPFSQAATLARQSLAPGFSGFIESNLAAIPLAPPGLDAEYTDGEIVSVVTGFAPVFTESATTVGRGQFLAGSNFSYFDLTKIRGEDLHELQFAFRQNSGSDMITAEMPFDIDAAVFTLHGAYGVTDRFDIGVALPVVRLSIENMNTMFRVEGNDTGCRYQPAEQGYDPAEQEGMNCEGQGTREVSPAISNFGAVAGTETFLSTVAVRAKYRFPFAADAGRLAAVVDMRLPVREESSALGSGHFGTRLTFIGEYTQLSTFKPYVNVGAQFWNGDDGNSLKAAVGFNQQLASRLFFVFDLLGEIELEPDPFLASIDNVLQEGADDTELSLAGSSIPHVERDHTLNAGLGLQFAFSPSFYAYGSALFALLDRGLQSEVAPTAGVALYF